MCRFYLILSILIFALLLVCSDKSTGPNEYETSFKNMVASLALQDSVGQRVVDWLAQTDTTAALNSGIKLLMNARNLVDTAFTTSQGIAIQFKNGMQGGIMIDAGDGLPVNAESAQPVSPPQKVSDGKPGIMKTLFYCPIYNERKEFADSIINSAERSFQKVDYEAFTLRLADECYLGGFSDFNEYGLIYFYSFSFLWPESSDSANVYLMTGDDVLPALDYFSQHDLEINHTAAIYVPGKGNMYFVPSGWIGFEGDPAPGAPVIYLGFANSFKGGWPEQMEDEFGIGGCIGYDGFPDAEHNLDWATGFYETMCDTSQAGRKTLAEWYTSIHKSYQYSGNVAAIFYTGADDYGLWNKVIISRLSSTWGDPADTIEIIGSGFGSDQTDGKVYFGQSEASVTSWSDTLIVFVVPDDAETDEVYVAVGTLASNSVNFNIFSGLEITSVSPDSGSYGDTIQIKGSGFSNLYPSLYFGDIQSTNVISWSDTLIKTIVPQGASLGEIEIKINLSSDWTNPYQFKVIPYATINSITPDWAQYGDVITYRGSGFGLQEGNESVFFQSSSGWIEGTILLWTDNRVKASIPEGAVSGSTYLQCGEYSGDQTYGKDIEVFGILKISPDLGILGNLIKIIGSGFGADQGTGYVTFEDTEANINKWTDTLIEAYVPEFMDSSKVYVHVNSLQSNGITFYKTDVPELFNLLHQTKYCKIEFNGYIKFGSWWNNRTFIIHNYPWELVNWNFDYMQFGKMTTLNPELLDYPHDDYKGACALIDQYSGMLDSIRTEEKTVGYFDNPGVPDDWQIGFRSFGLSNIPLAELETSGDTIVVIFELTGPDTQNHIHDIDIYNVLEDEWGNLFLRTEYIDTDWENTEYPPTIRVTFSNQPIP